MELSKRENDSDSATIISEYSDYKLWTVNDENEEYEEENLEEEDVYDEGKEVAVDDADIFADLVIHFRDKRAERIAAEAEAKKEQLRQLIGIKARKDVSEETLITPDDVSHVSTKSSTDSSIHPCLRDIDISDSQLKLQNLYTTFPIPDDPGLAPAFCTLEERRVTYDDDGIMKFYDLSKECGIQSIRTLKDMLLSDTINLQYYGLNQRAMRPLCEALMKNIFVQTVRLTENWLSEDGCYHLNDLLLRNNNIHTLILSGCRIGPKGVAKLSDGISSNATLLTLDLANCNIQNEGLDHLTSAVCNNSTLEYLSLNNNHLDESCTDTLQNLVSCSETLTRLDLSWNSLYTAKIWRKLIRGLESNEVLVDLDLSWNALGNECVRFLRRFLLSSTALKILKLNGNQFHDEDAEIIARGLVRNTTLEELYLGSNPLKSSGALALIRAVTPERSPESQLQVLDLTNIWAKKDVLVSLKAIENDRPWLKITLGGILGNYKTKGPNVKAILLKRANYEAMKQKIRKHRRNFGHFILSLTEELISRTKFAELVKSFQLRLSSTLLNEIVIAFSGANNTVDQELMKSTYMKLYPNTKPPTEKPVKKKRAKKTKLKKKKVKTKK